MNALSVLCGFVVVTAPTTEWKIPLEAFGGKKTSSVDNRVFAIAASVNDGPVLRLALDTNVGTVVIGDAAAKSAGLKPGSSITLDWASGDKVRANWIRNFKLKAGTFEGYVSYGLVVPSEEVSKVHSLDGMLGLSFLNQYRWSIDPRAGVLTLMDPESVSGVPKGDPVSIVVDRGKGIEVRVKVGSKSAEFVVHTGLSDVFVDAELAKELGISAEGPVLKDSPVPYKVGPKVTLELGTVRVPNVQVFVAEKPGWRHIGQSVWNRFVTTWDMQNQKVYLQKLD